MAELCFNTFNVSAYLLGEQRLAEQIDAAAAAGFPWFGPDVYSLRSWEAGGQSLGALRRLVEASGMRVWEIANLHLGERTQTLADAHDLARMARELGARWVLTNVGAPIDAALCELFDEVCSVLARDGAGARPAIEYLPWTPAHSIATTMPLIAHVGTERARILYDVWHHFRGPDTLADLDAAPADTVAYLQFSDALPMLVDDLTHETLERRTFPGEGELDLTGWCDRLKAKGFDGVVSVEILSAQWRTGDQREFARRAHESTRRYWP
jgi:sugar phosphate isomerase/epimerase